MTFDIPAYEPEEVYGSRKMREQTDAFARAMLAEYPTETRPSTRLERPWERNAPKPFTLTFPRFDISALLPLNKETMAGLLGYICARHRQNADAVKSDMRFSRLIPARQEFCWTAWMQGYSQSAIGRFLSHRNHATIGYHIRAYQARIDRGEVR